MFDLLKDNIREIQNCTNCFIDFQTNVLGVNYRFDVNLPDHIFPKVIEAFVKSRTDI
jgi:hypothetical protein